MKTFQNMLIFGRFPLKKPGYIAQAYFFTDFPASTETGISETLSLGGKFLSLAKEILEFSKKNP